jgi:hypothetical protein|tara:strand:+ start:2416 stop:2778 length:363 start_codon:yes stop_codon:yes gene_type:complete
MRSSNIKAKNWMIKHGYTDIWFKRHGKWHDKIYKNESESYSALDLWNLFDGLAWKGHRPVYFQIKTNGWANKIKLESWIKDKTQDALVLSVNVKGSDTHGWKVMNRIHERSEEGILERSV